ncbi:MAG: hypothetical protein WBQ76_01580 [Candidatus Korobacteraceae bacterium]
MTAITDSDLRAVDTHRQARSWAAIMGEGKRGMKASCQTLTAFAGL